MPLTAEEFSDVASFVGHAVWQIQVLEETVAVHLVMVHKVDAKTARRDAEEMFAKASRQTLGQLFGAVRDAGMRIAKTFIRTLGVLNWLGGSMPWRTRP